MAVRGRLLSAVQAADWHGCARQANTLCMGRHAHSPLCPMATHMRLPPRLRPSHTHTHTTHAPRLRPLPLSLVVATAPLTSLLWKAPDACAAPAPRALANTVTRPTITGLAAEALCLLPAWATNKVWTQQSGQFMTAPNDDCSW